MSVMTIINMSFRAVFLIAVIVAIRALTVYRLPKKTFYIMWGIALCQLLIPYNLFARFDVSHHIASLIGKLKNILAKAPVASDLIATVNPINIADTVSMAAESSSQPVLHNIFISAHTGSQIDSYTSPLLLVWAAGFVCCTVYFLITHIKFRRVYSEALPVDNTFVSSWTAELSGSMKRKVRIKQSDVITSPLTYGIFRPVVLLPFDMDYNDETTLKYILFHEYTHIWRFDTLSKLVLTAALCIHWFNPFVWVMYILANRDIELSCDEAVVRKMIAGEDSKSDYAAALITLAEKKSLAVLGIHFSVNFSFGKNVMRERINSIMKTPKSSILKIISSVMLVSVVIMTSAGMQSSENDEETAEQKTEIIKTSEAEMQKLMPELPENTLKNSVNDGITYISSVKEFREFIIKNSGKMYDISYTTDETDGRVYATFWQEELLTLVVLSDVVVFTAEMPDNSQISRILAYDGIIIVRDTNSDGHILGYGLHNNNK